jgi:hypothetical protein
VDLYLRPPNGIGMPESIHACGGWRYHDRDHDHDHRATVEANDLICYVFRKTSYFPGRVSAYVLVLTINQIS